MKKLTLPLMCLFFVLASYAQQERTCHSMKNLLERQKLDPTLEERMNDIESFTQQRIADLANVQGKIEGSIITIPVVVHIIYNNTSQNISDAQILSQIEVLNEDFRRTNADADNKWSQAADTQIEFALATIDENGNTTTGITRKFSSTSAWNADTDNMKYSSQGGVSAWDTNSYLNMWVCPLESGLLGYAQFPGGIAATDGVVIAPQYFGSSDYGSNFYLSAPFDKGRTTTHEVGHFLNLRHIWGDGGCGVDDFVSDTPTSDAANTGCDTSHTSCGTLDMVENYMDYTDDACMNLFTEGQKSRMRAVLESGGSRNSLALSDKFGDGGTDPTTPTACASTISSFPYTESFESGSGWTQAIGDDGDWVNDSAGTTSSNTGPSSGADGTFYMFLEASSNSSAGQIGANATAILESPCFNLTSASSAKFTFKNHMYGTSVGSLVVQASTDGVSWTSLWSDADNQGNQWNSESVSLNAYAGTTVRLRFVGTTGTSWSSDIAIDDLELTTSGGSTADTSAPTTPSNLTVSNVTETTATISWSASSDNVGVTAYNVYRSGVLLGSVTGTSANLTGLSAGTTYSYDVSAVDAAGNESSLNAVTFTTTSIVVVPVAYCGSEGSDSSYEWIDYVAFGGFTNSTGDNGGYADFTSTSAFVAPGSTNTLVISAGFASSSYTEYWKIWIDYNQDGSFDDDEVVASGSSSSADNLSVEVTIPSTAATGTTRMRVSMKYDAEQTACETFSYGEVEDYAVTISNSARTSDSDVFATALGNESVLDVVAYPSPANSFVNVKLNRNDSSEASYSIINTIGQSVLSGKLESTTINVSQLKTGIYILEVYDSQKLLKTKFIKN